MAKLSDYFELINGVSTSNLEIHGFKTEEFNLLFIRPSKTAIGSICGYVRESDIPIDKVFEPQTIYVSTNGEGSHTYSYVSYEKFSMNSDVSALKPLINLNIEEKLFYSLCITKNRYRFSYGRKPKGDKLSNLEIPDIDNIPKWVDATSICPVETSVISKKVKRFNTNTWSWFRLCGKNGLFEMESCKCKNAGELLEAGDEIDYIGAKKLDGGFMDRVQENKELVTKGNCIVFICDGQGSVGYVNYREKDFIGSTTLTVGRNSRLNKYNGLFLTAVLDLERYRYSFGRKYKTNLSRTKIKLPSKNGHPDWEYMEAYIKSLPYSDCI